MERRDRADLLERAEGLLEEASSLITEAMRGTGLEPLAEGTCGRLRDIVGSEEDGGSILNMRRDVLDMEEEAIWTRPLVSVKNANRRDI